MRRQCRRMCFSPSLSAFLSLSLFFNLTQLSQLISEYLIVWQISHAAPRCAQSERSNTRRKQVEQADSTVSASVYVSVSDSAVSVYSALGS